MENLSFLLNQNLKNIKHFRKSLNAVNLVFVRFDNNEKLPAVEYYAPLRVGLYY